MYVKRSSVAQTPRLELRNIIVGVLFKGNIYQLNTVVWVNRCISCRCACLFFVVVVVNVPLIWGKTGFEEKRRLQLHHSIKRKTKEQEKDWFFFSCPHTVEITKHPVPKRLNIFTCVKRRKTWVPESCCCDVKSNVQKKERGEEKKTMSAHWNGNYQQRLKSFRSFISMRLVLKNK